MWWYKINNEARRFLNDASINPRVSVLAVTLGALIVVPPFVSAYSTTGRIARMQERAGFPPGTRANPWISVLLHFVFGAHALYMQIELNRIWDAYAQPGRRGAAADAPLHCRRPSRARRVAGCQRGGPAGKDLCGARRQRDAPSGVVDELGGGDGERAPRCATVARARNRPPSARPVEGSSP